MVQLENVEFLTFPSLLERVNSSKNLRHQHQLKEFLNENNITNYQVLYDTLSNAEKEEYLQPLYAVIEKILKQIKRANSDGVEIQIYPSIGYGSTELDQDTIEKTEKETSSAKLLYNAPTSWSGDVLMSRQSVYETKYLLSHTTPRGKCALIGLKSHLGNRNAEKLQQCINLYEQQVLRQYDETHMRGINLFELNKQEKQILVEEQLPEIIDYLTDTAKECIWGTFPDDQKKALLDSLTNPKKIWRDRRQNLIDMVSYYSTVSELEKGAVKTKVIDRFITKK